MASNIMYRGFLYLFASYHIFCISFLAIIYLRVHTGRGWRDNKYSGFDSRSQLYYKEHSISVKKLEILT